LSPRGNIFFLIDSIIASYELPGKSVLPIAPAKRVSPEKSISSIRRQVPPGVWPGVCKTLILKSPREIVSESFKNLSTTGGELHSSPTEEA